MQSSVGATGQSYQGWLGYSRYPEPLSGQTPAQAAEIFYFLTSDFISQSYCAQDQIQSSKDSPVWLCVCVCACVFSLCVYTYK